MVDISDYIAEGNKTALWTAFRNVFSHNEMLRLEIKMLEMELQDNWADNEKFKFIIKKMKNWISELQNDILKLEKARAVFRDRRMMEELSDDKKWNLDELKCIAHHNNLYKQCYY